MIDLKIEEKKHDISNLITLAVDSVKTYIIQVFILMTVQRPANPHTHPLT